MSPRFAALVVTACLCPVAGAQAQTPNLTRGQRDLLHAIVTAVDAASSEPETTDLNWQQHIMRASDGSHYVAFSIEPPASAALPAGPAMLYVRLATAAPPGAQPIAERSPVKEWLAGGRTDPRLLPRRGIIVGEMPIMGATGNLSRRPPTTTGENELRLMGLERERARQQQEERDKKRRAELEGREAASRDLLPFEDFDLASQSTTAAGTRTITRAFTAGPGDYDLYLAWADPASPKPQATIRVVRKTLTLEPARTVGLITSSVILAERVTQRAEPYSPAEQASHPYSIGAMEIVPARSSRYRPEDNLSVALQVINAQSNDAGMPDVAVNFRIVKVAGARESAVASLKPQIYNEETLPSGFNLKQGHPIFAAVSAPLATLGRGDYRLKITVADRIANTVANSETDFTIVATAASLLAEAPPLGPPFRREALFEPRVLGAVVDALTPAATSPALTRALATAKTGKLADLLTEDAVPEAEAGIRTALTALALLSIGDTSSAVQFQRAQLLGAPPAMTKFLSGAARAMQSRDVDAIAAWQEALAAGAPKALVVPQLLDAYLRQRDYKRAAPLAEEARQSRGSWARGAAAALIATQREADAIAMIDARLAASPDDSDAQWLLLHALFSQLARNPTSPTAARDRFTISARAYVDAKGNYASLVEEWLASMR